MINGDISNETPPRIIVHADVVIDSELVEKKRVLLPSTMERQFRSLKNKELSHLWTLANKYGLSVELAGFAQDLWTQEQLDKLMARLDSRGGNPFNYAEVYDTIDDFIGELPYRANLKGVVDVTGRVGRYGSKGIELYNL
jgi:hypothetical protein